MLSKEDVEKRYLETYNEEIVFDKVERRGSFLVASKKVTGKRFFVGAGKVENERNTQTYYVIGNDIEMKMVATSQTETEIPHRHVDKSKNTAIEIYKGNTLQTSFDATGVYIDVTDKVELSKFLAGAYPDARYNAPLPKDKEKLFSDWHHSREDASILEKKYEKYRQAEMEELKTGLQQARLFFVEFIGSKKELKMAKEQVSVMGRIKKFCKRLSTREPDIKLVFDRYTDNNRF